MNIYIFMDILVQCDGSGGKMLIVQACQYEFYPLNLQEGTRREQTPQNCPLTSKSTQQQAPLNNNNINKQINK